VKTISQLGEVTTRFQLVSNSLRTGTPLPAYLTPLLETAFSHHHPYTSE
jgi:hypothetical protein